MNSNTPSQAAPPPSPKAPKSTKPPHGKDWGPVFRRLLGWSLFTLTSSLLPILFNWLSEFIRGKTLILIDLTSRGELLLISVAITAASIGEMIDYGSKHTYNGREIFAIDFSMLTMIFASFLYSDITSAINSEVALDQFRTSFSSSLVFFFATLASGINIALSAK